MNGLKLEKKYCLLSIVIFWGAALFWIIYTGGEAWKFLIWQCDTVGIFPDAMQTIAEAKYINPYDSIMVAIYPPFTYMFFELFAWMIPGELSWESSVTQVGSLVLAILFTTIILLLFVVIDDYLSMKKIKIIALFIAFLLSPSFIYALERGNLVILALFFLTNYLVYKDSSNKIIRELAFVSLAMAAALKIYPAIFGLILVIEKRYRDSVRCLLYGILFVVVPFWYYPTGSFGKMIKGINWFSYLNDNDTYNWGYGFRIGIKTWVNAIIEKMHLDKDLAFAITICITMFFLIMLINVVILSADVWKKVCALTLIIVVVPTFSWEYNIIYMIIPLMCFLKKFEEKSYIEGFVNIMYLLTFYLIFIPLPYGVVWKELHGIQKISISTFVNSCGLAFMVVLLFIDTIACRIEIIKNNE